MKKLLTLIALVITGCVHEPPQSPFPASQQQLEKPRANYASGSLWQGSSSGLAEDFRARSKGDVVTVVITETASASKQATTDTVRTTALSAGIPNLMGLESRLANLGNLLNANTSSKYDGSGSTTRTENLNATISARVVDILGNGNFLIEGRRNIMVNHEDQIIVLEGTVRPQDISPDNTVNSSQIADARITYSGKGIISDRQSPGWLMNIVDRFWPF